MEQPIFETRTKVVQWGLLLNALVFAPLSGIVAAVLVVPLYAPWYPERYQSEAALEALTGTVILWLLGFVLVTNALAMLIFSRQRFRVYPDRLDIETGALIGRRRKTFALAEITRVSTRRSLLGFGHYGVVTVRARRRRKAQFKGVLGYRELAAAVMDGLPTSTDPDSLRRGA